VRIEGRLTSCRTDSDGSIFTLSGQTDSYRSVAGPLRLRRRFGGHGPRALGCGVCGTARSATSPSTAAIPTYGMTVAGRILRSANQDMRIGRIDAAVFLLLHWARLGRCLL